MQYDFRVLCTNEGEPFVGYEVALFGIFPAKMDCFNQAIRQRFGESKITGILRGIDCSDPGFQLPHPQAIPILYLPLPRVLAAYYAQNNICLKSLHKGASSPPGPQTLVLTHLSYIYRLTIALRLK
jgi:hypothetical protein